MAGTRQNASITNTIFDIDPTDMSKLETSIAGQFLKERLKFGLGLIRKDTVYEDFTYLHPVSGVKAVCDLQFCYSLALYISDKHPERDSFAVIGDTCLGLGGTAAVNKVKGKLKWDSSGSLVYISNKSAPTDRAKKARNKHVIKVEMHKKDWTREITINAYHLAHRNKNLGIKYPVFFRSENTSVTVMKRLKDYNLDDVLELKYENRKLFDEIINKTKRWELFELLTLEELGFFAFSYYDRLVYCREILKSYNEQIRDVKVEHRDIKAENIIVDFSEILPRVTFFDYGAARDAREQDSRRLYGSIGYIPPEVLEHSGAYTGKSDLYSLACVLAQIWHDKSAYVEPPEDDPLGYLQAKHRQFNLGAIAPESVQDILNRMAVRQPKNRPTSDEVIAVFDEEIRIEEEAMLASVTPPPSPAR